MLLSITIAIPKHILHNNNKTKIKKPGSGASEPLATGPSDPKHWFSGMLTTQMECI